MVIHLLFNKYLSYNTQVVCCLIKYARSGLHQDSFHHNKSNFPKSLVAELQAYKFPKSLGRHGVSGMENVQK